MSSIGRGPWHVRCVFVWAYWGEADTCEIVGPDDPRPWGATYPGKDYSNPYVRDFFSLEAYNDDSVDRSRSSTRCWHLFAPFC